MTIPLLQRTAPEPEEKPKIENLGKKILTGGGAILAIAISGFFIYRTMFPPMPKVDNRGQLYVGEALANETARVLEDKGSIVIVTGDLSFAGPSLAKDQVTAFNDRIKRKAGIVVKGTEPLKAEAMMRLGPDSGLPSSTVFKILESHPGLSAIVSFVGSPSLKDDEIAKLGPTPPKFIVFAQMQMGMSVNKLVAAKVVQSAIVTRMFPPPQGAVKKPTNGREMFEQMYEILTPETVSATPGMPGVPPPSPTPSPAPTTEQPAAQPTPETAPAEPSH